MTKCKVEGCHRDANPIYSKRIMILLCTVHGNQYLQNRAAKELGLPVRHPEVEKVAA